MARQEHTKSSSFWFNNECHDWTTIEVPTALEGTFEDSRMVYHSLDNTWSKDREEVIDIELSPRDSHIRTVAVKVRCEKVSENERTYGRLVRQTEEDKKRIEAVGDINHEWRKAKVDLVGFGGEEFVQEYGK